MCLSLASPLGLDDHYGGGYEDLHSYDLHDFGHTNYDHGQIARISLGDHHHEYEHHGHEEHGHHEEEHVDYYVSIFYLVTKSW